MNEPIIEIELTKTQQKMLLNIDILELDLKQVYSDRNFARISTCRRSADRWRDSRLAALHSVQVVV